MTRTEIDDAPAGAAWEQIRLRAEWLRTLEQWERDGLDAVPLRVVDARFQSWLDARGDVGDDGGG